MKMTLKTMEATPKINIWLGKKESIILRRGISIKNLFLTFGRN
jgi:hypothetical protein